MPARLKKLLIAILAISPMAFGAEYLIPYDYDNMVQSVKSQGYGVISQTSTLSTTQWNIGGTNRNYRCLTIPKISCSAATTVLYANVSELVLTKPDGTVSNQKAMFPFIYDIRYEDAGTNWRLCGAAIGGEMYDNVAYSGGQITYTPNQYSNTYTYFTNVAITNSTAYMTLTYNQVCQ
ncbi:MAG: hypothetical protein M1300_07505 [Epsilonproteobacteria bacterium]|nr:hypothetical protein [Campylobacterota bacterium]